MHKPESITLQVEMFLCNEAKNELKSYDINKINSNCRAIQASTRL